MISCDCASVQTNFEWRYNARLALYTQMTQSVCVYVLKTVLDPRGQGGERGGTST